MRKLLAWSGIAVMTCLIGVASVQAAEDSTTLSGTYVWENGNSTGDLEAVFTPTGEDRWDVSFHFAWEDGPHVYTGTAEGSLSEGELTGQVVNDNQDHEATFRFRGSFENGKFNGEHGHVQENGRLKDTGTFSLKPAG